MTIVGRTYLERGAPVEIVAQWSQRGAPLMDARYPISLTSRIARGGPRNVLIRRPDGELVVRPFRGLRRAA